jgi:glycosyltransferase involved in cell wall biosynthesis
MPPWVLVVTPCYPRFPGDFNGGFVRDLCLRLAERGVDLMVLAPRSRTMGPQDAPYPVRRFPYLPLQGAESLPEETMKGAPLGRLIQLPLYMASAIIHASAGEPALIHSHIAIPLGFAVSLAPVKAPRIITCHGSDCTLPLDNPAYRPFTRHALRRADAVVTVSKYVETLARRLGARNVETIYLGVDTLRFKPPVDRRALRAGFGVPDGALVVGTLGRLVREKNIPDLIEAAETVSKKLDAFFLIGGDGPERSRLEAVAREKGLSNMVFTGAIRDTPSFLGLLDVFTFPSSREGLSLSLQEAMATGCVPVAAKGHGSDEVIEEGENGFLHPPGDAAALAEKIIEAADNLHLSKKARSTIVQRFDAEAGADRYAELYHRLAF